MTLDLLIAGVEEKQVTTPQEQKEPTIDDYYKKFLDSPLRNIEKELKRNMGSSAKSKADCSESSAMEIAENEEKEEEDEEEDEEEEEAYEESSRVEASSEQQGGDNNEEDSCNEEPSKGETTFETAVEDQNSMTCPLGDETGLKTPFGMDVIGQGFDLVTPMGRSPFMDNVSGLRMENISILNENQENNRIFKENFRDVSPIRPVADVKGCTTQDSMRITSMLSPGGLVVENLMERFQRQTHDEIEEIIQKHTKGIKLTPSRKNDKGPGESLFAKKLSPKKDWETGEQRKPYVENNFLRSLETLESFHQDEAFPQRDSNAERARMYYERYIF